MGQIGLWEAQPDDVPFSASMVRGLLCGTRLSTSLVAFFRLIGRFVQPEEILVRIERQFSESFANWNAVLSRYAGDYFHPVVGKTHRSTLTKMSSLGLLRPRLAPQLEVTASLGNTMWVVDETSLNHYIPRKALR